MKKRANPTDVHVGGRLRAVRQLAGMSQERLGAAVDLSFQQIQKYEKGMNRIGASRLQQFAEIFNVPPAYFFDDLPSSFETGLAGVEDGGDTQVPATAFAAELIRETRNAPLTQGQAAELVRCFLAIGDRELRDKIYQLVKACAAARAGSASSGPTTEHSAGGGAGGDYVMAGRHDTAASKEAIHG